MRKAVLIAGLILGSVGFALAQDGKPGDAPPGQAAGETKTSPEEQFIRLADDAFVRDYNKADTKALLARFTEDAEVIEEDGTRYRGHGLIEERLAETFAASPGIKIGIKSDSIQLLSPDVIKAEGRTVVTPAKGSPEFRRHTALLVRRDGRWLISSIREEADPLITPHDRLKELEWMLGEWVDEGPDSHIRVSCRWSEDGNFLLRTFTINVQGKPVLTVHQRVGWDPLARQVHSWEFDSEGGYGEGKWSRDGERWVIKHAGVRPEGVTASATHIVSRERSDLVRWEAVDRVLGNENVSQERTYAMVRVPPQPQVPPSGPKASTSTSK
jgi:uncharacterized protein (TIGR02246 family)